jgi:hypothetical protein
MNSLLQYYEIRLDLYDLSLAFIYFILIYIFAFYYKRKKISKNPEYKYFILALSLKVFGGLMFALLTVYYYKGGDTMGYYHAAIRLSEEIVNNPISGFEILLTKFKAHQSIQFSPWESTYFMDVNAKDILIMIKITTIINLLGLFSYGATTVIFSAISFVGLWVAYSNICKIYPKYSKHLLISFFMIPSIVFWGSGVLKDTVTLSCMGWLIYSFSNIFILKRKTTSSIFLIIISSVLIMYLKPYILYVLIPCLMIWGQSNLKNLIKGSFIRIILIPLIILTISFATFTVLKKVSSDAGRYDVNNLEKTLEGFHTWHNYLSTSQDQSGYTLGDMEFTPLGYLRISPAGFNVTFFRPYIWEIRNIPTLIGAIESLLIFLFFAYLLLKLRGKFFEIIIKNKDILFMMIFSTIFGIIVGISSYNFGALSRYKMPAQLLFVTALFLIFNLAKDERKSNLKR